MAAVIDVRRGRVARLAWTLPAGIVVAITLLLVFRGALAYDTLTYLAAGERLNAGHGLYSLVPGDRPVYVHPPIWTVPLVSPPPIAVLWRPLAALPSEAGRWLWLAANAVALGFVVAVLARHRPGTTAGLLLLVAIPAAHEIAFGNMSGFLLLGMVGMWWAYVTGHSRLSGVVGGLMAAVKLTPLTMIWWLLVTGQSKALLAAVGTIVTVAVVSVIGAGVGSHVEYLKLVTGGSAIGIYDWSLGGAALALGLPRDLAAVAPMIGAILGLVAMFVLRKNVSASYAAAVITTVIGSPAVNVNWFVLLLALIAPLAWPAVTEADTESVPNPADERFVVQVEHQASGGG